MRKFWKIASLKTKIALLLSLIAFISSIVGLFILKSEMRIICWSCLIVVWAINYWIVLEENVKLGKESYLKDYEIIELKYSYRRMGIYIDSLDFEQLKDIKLMIENELRDIEIKKEHMKEKVLDAAK